jgi:DNA-binding LacI/PurR family transcriptional regulator
MIDAPIETPTSVIAPSTSAEDRLEGLTKYLTAHRLRPRAVVYGRSYSHEAGLTLTKQLLRHGGIDAISCADDMQAMGAKNQTPVEIAIKISPALLVSS